MKRKYQILGLITLMFCSVVYDFVKPEKMNQQAESMSYVILEGEFKKHGKYEFEGEKCLKDIVEEVGVSEKANMDALCLDKEVIDEMRIYLPIKQECISLNSSSKEELMTLKGIGEKTAEKIIEYRKGQPFTCLEDIMNVSGIGEKTYLKLRDSLCL